MKIVDENNFLLYAAKHYDNPNCTDVLEFNEDLNRIKYIKRLFKKYAETGELKERLIINHLTVVYNVFKPEAATKMLCFKLCDYLHLLKPFLELLNYWPEYVSGIGSHNYSFFSWEIESDQLIEDRLKEI